MALTFDDGPSPFTPRILDVLKANDVKATFFFIGRNVETYPSIARAVTAAGHAIGNHSYSHPNMVLESESQVKEELARSEAAISKATGVKPTIFRPPYGTEDRAMLHESEALGYRVVLWSVVSQDWKRPGVEKIVKNVIPAVKNGAIILMHDGGGDRSQTVAALDEIILELKKQGYRFVTVPELLDMPDSCP